MNIAVLAGLSDEKLTSKLVSLTNCSEVNSVYLIRREPLVLENIISIHPPYILQKSKILSELFRVLNLFIILCQNKVDAVVGVHLCWHGVWAVHLARLFRTKSVLLLTEDPRKYENKSFLNKCIQSFDWALTRGESSKLFLEDTLGVKQVKVLPNVFIFSSHSDRTNIKYDIVFTGSLTKNKNVGFIIEIVKILSKKIPSLKVAIVGTGPEEGVLKEVVNNYQLNNVINFLGHMPSPSEVMSSSKIFLMASKSEGLPMVLIEAMDQGLPCVAPNIGDIKDVIRHGENGYLIEGDDINEYVEKCERLLSDEELYKELAGGAITFKTKKSNEYSLGYATSVWGSVLR
ncbi:MAG: glycosyltransferase involved in cell wall biosynthesis [Candidatus Omnitrophota bacterium]|jgi:glycosyltransferase involved in cell wall biosynthesis